MTPAQFARLSDADILTIAGQLQVGYGLKRTMRYGTARDMSVHSESTAEHVFALHYLSLFFLPLEDAEGRLDRAAVQEIITFHDFGEIPDGDVPYHLKTPQLEARERENARLVFKALPSPLSRIGHARWKEYEERNTSEGRFVYALDNIEPLFELMPPQNAASLKRLGFTYELHTEKKLRATELFPAMRRFVTVMSADMRRRGVFYE